MNSFTWGCTPIDSSTHDGVAEKAFDTCGSVVVNNLRKHWTSQPTNPPEIGTNIFK